MQTAHTTLENMQNNLWYGMVAVPRRKKIVSNESIEQLLSGTFIREKTQR
jgi:hypothetical protein